jgi:succinate dehydrogenase flavin-adding protein (antitoxin of CptAB toxin-antitoxin module)
MESRIISQIEQFISYLLGENNENDREQRVYHKLLRLEGDNLEGWMNEKFKNYIIAKKYNFEFRGDDFEGIYGQLIFKNWYYSQLDCKTDELMKMEDYQIIIDKIQKFQKKFIHYHEKLDWKIAIITDYMEMYIMSMSSSDLKKYIIQLI